MRLEQHPEHLGRILRNMESSSVFGVVAVEKMDREPMFDKGRVGGLASDADPGNPAWLATANSVVSR